MHLQLILCLYIGHLSISLPLSLISRTSARRNPARPSSWSDWHSHGRGRMSSDPTLGQGSRASVTERMLRCIPSPSCSMCLIRLEFCCCIPHWQIFGRAEQGQSSTYVPSALAPEIHLLGLGSWHQATKAIEPFWLICLRRSVMHLLKFSVFMCHMTASSSSLA